MSKASAVKLCGIFSHRCITGTKRTLMSCCSHRRSWSLHQQSRKRTWNNGHNPGFSYETNRSSWGKNRWPQEPGKTEERWLTLTWLWHNKAEMAGAKSPQIIHTRAGTRDGAKITFAQDLSTEMVQIWLSFHPVIKQLTSMPSVDSSTTPADSGSYTAARSTSSQPHRRPKCSTRTFLSQQQRPGISEA